MAKRTSSLEELLDATALVPWWVGVALAGASYVLLSWVAGVDWFARAEGGVDTGGMVSAFVTVLAMFGRVALPLVFLAGALVSVSRQLRMALSRRGKTVRDMPFERKDPWEGVPEGDLPVQRAGSRAPPVKGPDVGKWSLALIQSIEWMRLEELSAAYFGQLGFRAQLPAGGADGGVDIHLYWEDATEPGIIVQCKAWRSKQVGVEALRAFYGVMTSDKIAEGVFITSGTFSVEAKAFCAGKNMHLIDGADLLAKIGQLDGAQQQGLLALATQGDFLTPSCPTCRIKMLFRPGKAQDSGFWGCANFPRCRNKLYSAREA